MGPCNSKPPGHVEPRYPRCPAMIGAVLRAGGGNGPMGVGLSTVAKVVDHTYRTLRTPRHLLILHGAEVERHDREERGEERTDESLAAETAVAGPRGGGETESTERHFQANQSLPPRSTMIQ